MLSNKQSLALTGFMVAGIFVFGVLDILDNFIVLTLLTLVFFAIIINLVYTNYRPKEKNQSFTETKSIHNE